MMPPGRVLNGIVIRKAPVATKEAVLAWSTSWKHLRYKYATDNKHLRLPLSPEKKWSMMAPEKFIWVS